MRRTLGLLAACCMAVLLSAGCSGDAQREFEGTASGGTNTEAGVPATEVLLTQSAVTVTSDGRQTVRFFATVKGAGNVALAAQPVVFSASGEGITLTVVSPETGAQGQPAEALLSITESTNRALTVTASSGGRSASGEVSVVGTSVAITGPVSVPAGMAASFEVLVKDASGGPLAGKSLTAASAAGNPVSLVPTSTDARGAASLVLTPASSGTDTVTVSAAGATGQLTVQVSPTAVNFESPPEATEIVVNSPPRPIRVRVLENGVPLANTPIGFTSTRGTLGAATATTDGAGYASTTIVSPETGRALVAATAPNGTVSTREMSFIADRAARIEVQASPTTVGVNPQGSTSESSQITAVVRDLANNPVRGARVNFTASDPSGGAGLLQSYALTDASGRATTTFVPGPLPTGTNRIVVTGTVDCSYTASGVQCVPPGAGVLFTDQTQLTASRRTLQIRIGTGNEIKKIASVPAPVFNEMPYGVVVTDSAGNPVGGVRLNATVVGLDYRKGFWFRIPCGPGDPCWAQQVDATCPSEDANTNLLLDPGEDLNADGFLTPGNVGAAYFGPTGELTSAVSDSEGSAVLRIRYLRDRSLWVNVRIRVTASVPDGTEGAETVAFVLPVISADLKDAGVPPPGGVSPYGTGGCP